MQWQPTTLARWLAQQAVKAQWRAEGRKVDHVEAIEIATAANVYFIQHRDRLIEEARAHPATGRFRHQQRMRLARKAVIAQIREKGQGVSSIAPDELRKLIEAYLKEHPDNDGVTICVQNF
jgi:hypothetical protein